MCRPRDGPVGLRRDEADTSGLLCRYIVTVFRSCLVSSILLLLTMTENVGDGDKWGSTFVYANDMPPSATPSDR